MFTRMFHEKIHCHYLHWCGKVRISVLKSIPENLKPDKTDKKSQDKNIYNQDKERKINVCTIQLCRGFIIGVYIHK